MKRSKAVGIATPEQRLRRASLRRQLRLMEEVRDRVHAEDPDDFGEWMEALVPLTDRIIRDLQELEWMEVYPVRSPWDERVTP